MTAARREETEMSDRGLLKHVNMANLRGDEKGVSPRVANQANQWFLTYMVPPNICLLETSLIFL